VSEGNLLVVSSPSGAGKTSVLRRALGRNKKLAVAISATTRAPRRGEVDGRDYHFLSREEFLRRIEDGEFVEWANVHGRLYGTLRAEVDRILRSGRDAVLEIDVQGMAKLKKQGEDFVSVFIMPPSTGELERRLRQRGTESPEELQTRLENAKKEMDRRFEYDYVIVNDDLDKAVSELLAIAQAEHNRN
jgi:guanylate kinase